MPSITDFFGKASPDTHYGVATTVKVARLAEETVLSCFDVSNFADDTPVFFITYKKSTDPDTGEVSIVNQTGWKGIVDTDNNTITNLELAPGYTDDGNDVGDFVECIPTSHWVNSLIEGLRVSHNDNGTLKNTIPFTNLNANLLEGWIYDSNTWTYVSGTGTITGVFKISGINATSYLQAGMPFKIVQSGVTKYGFITKVAFSTDTTVTCLMAATNGTVDNSGIENATISTPAFGKPKQPGFGFPLDPAKWSITYSASTTRSTVSTSYSNLTDALVIPIGAWKLRYEYGLKLNSNTDAEYTSSISFSSNPTTETDPDLTSQILLNPSATNSTTTGCTVSREKYIDISSITTYTLIGKVSSANATLATNNAMIGKIAATCAYL